MKQQSLLYSAMHERTNDFVLSYNVEVIKQILLGSIFAVITPCFFYQIVYCSSRPGVSFSSFFAQPDFLNLMASIALSLFLQYMWVKKKTKTIKILQGFMGLLAGIGFLMWSVLVFDQDGLYGWVFSFLYSLVTAGFATLLAFAAARVITPKFEEDHEL